MVHAVHGGVHTLLRMCIQYCNMAIPVPVRGSMLRVSEWYNQGCMKIGSYGPYFHTPLVPRYNGTKIHFLAF